MAHHAPTDPALYHGQYPRWTSDFADLEQCVERFLLPGLLPTRPLIDKTTQIQCQGSCFAENIAKEMKRQGYNASLLAIEEVANTPKTNAELMARIVVENGVEFHKLTKSGLFVLSLGVAGGTFPECAKYTAQIIESLKSANPSMAIVVTVSPVPINRTHQPAAVVSDCASKSILRTVVHGLMGANLPNLYYWPSFEMVRWLGSHVQEPMYGKDDDLHRHVNNDMVALIARLFLKHYAA